MAIEIEITDRPITEPKSLRLDPSEVGAALEYRDLVRSHPTISTSDADPATVRIAFERVARKISDEFDLPHLHLVQRMGTVPIGETRLLVRILAAHTSEAFRAMLELLDNLKRVERSLDAMEAEGNA